MTLSEFLVELRAKAVQLRKDGDELCILANPENMDALFREKLRAHKRALLDLIGNDSDEWWSPPPTITPEMLTLVRLSESEIARIIDEVPGGAANVQDIYPLAPLQEGILFHHLMASQGDPYILSNLFRFDTRPRLDGFLRALQAVVDRHDILRTGIAWEGLSAPVQVVRRKAQLPVEEVFLNPDQGDPAEALRERFNPRHFRIDVRRAPLLRGYFATDAVRGSWLLLLLLHHLAGDHSTLDMMQAEIRALLQGQADQLPSPLPFRNFVALTRLGTSQEEHETFFKDLLGDMDEPTMPFGLRDVQGDGNDIEEAHLAVDADLARRIRECGRRLKASAASIFHLAWAQVLARVSGREDVVFGTVLFGRMQGGAGAGRMLGLFINTLPIRIRIGAEGAEASVRHMHALSADLMRHEHASLALAQRCSGVPAPAPLFSALLNYRHNPGAVQVSPVEAAGAWTGIERLRSEERTNYPFMLSVDDLGKGFSLTAQIQTPVEPMRVCKYMHTALERIVEALEKTPQRSLRSLDVLPEVEYQQVVIAFNRTRVEYPKDKTIHQLFEEQADRTPEAIALVFEGQTLTYDQLNRKANPLAHYLRSLGVGPDILVGICVERSLEMVIGLLAILKAGGAYVPMDPNYPQERMAFMLADAKARVLLTQASLASALILQPALLNIVCLDRDADGRSSYAESNPGPLAGSSSLAYVIYTSGSTGIPKGVAIAHQSTVTLLHWANQVFDPETLAGVLASTSVCFDLSIFEIFGPLSWGGTVILMENALRLGGLKTSPAVTLINTVPSVMKELMRTNDLPESVKVVNLAGEPLATRLVQEIYKHRTIRKVFDLYGPTEATTYSTCALRSREGPETIGRPIANTRMYVLDAWKQPVPIGAPGELYIGGAGLARCYLDRPELTAERFIPDPFSGEPNARLYKTGDLVRYQPEGEIEYLGRLDYQVKIRGFRIETGEIEAALGRHGQIREASVVAREDMPGDKRLVAYLVAKDGSKPEIAELRMHLKKHLPEHMVPAAFVMLDSLPLTPNGKVDRKALPAPDQRDRSSDNSYRAPRSEAEQKIAGIWRETLHVESVGIHDNFFDLGGHSLLVMQVLQKLKSAFDREISIRDLFRYTTVAALAQYLDPIREQTDQVIQRAVERAQFRQDAAASADIAIIGLAGSFPEAPNLDEFWKNLCQGKESITFFSDKELLAAGTDPERLKNPLYVRAQGILSDIDCFDAHFFGMSPREAEMTDPQQRLFLECAWQALEKAGYDAKQYPGEIGLYGGTTLSTYVLNNLYSHPGNIRALDSFQALLGNDKDFLTTLVSYKLNLNGPSLTVQSACSTSLVAVYEACQSLMNQKCDMALAGGVSITVPQATGYFYTPEGIMSPDGHCRPFDAKAQGTVGGQGVGLVVLKRLGDALKDGDTIQAVIKASAINNDGGRKIGYTAPSEDGQVEVITKALTLAKVNPETITYVEGHGTGTALGDPIEVAALTRTFRAHTQTKQYCALGSVKSNIGHLDAAAGVTGLIKTVLCLTNKLLVPSLHFTEPNPTLHLDESPFYVNTELREWKSNGEPRRAGVSSFGMGGTNAHVIVEEAPEQVSAETARPYQLLFISAKTETALEQATANLRDYLEKNPAINLADAAYTLQVGRRSFDYRSMLVSKGHADALEGLGPGRMTRLMSSVQPSRQRPVTFMFSGLGDHYAHMAEELYQLEPVFRKAVDLCSEHLKPLLKLDLREILYPAEAKQKPETPGLDLRQMLGRSQSPRSEADRRLNQTETAHAAVFVVEYALVELLRSWGIIPDALIGYSLGEYVAACVASVFSLQDALTLVVQRARMIQGLPKAGMLTAALSEDQVQPFLKEDIYLAIVNGRANCVLAGSDPALTRLAQEFKEQGISYHRIETNHGMHCGLMEPLAAEFTNLVKAIRLHKPMIPYLSNVTGDWITDPEAMDPGYWARHLCRTVKFAQGLDKLLGDHERIFIEIGPGQSLSSFAKQHPACKKETLGQIFATLRYAYDPQSDQAFLLETLGKLWLCGMATDWQGFYGEEHRRRIPLPTYPFARERYWIEPGRQSTIVKHKAALHKKPDMADWFYRPSWKPAKIPGLMPDPKAWLILGDDPELAKRLKALGHTVNTVRAGTEFCASDPRDGYTLHPRQPQDYDKLLGALGQVPQRIVYFTKEGFDFYGLIFLVQALSRHPPAKIEINIITSHAQRISPRDEVDPFQVMVLGPALVIPQEYPGLICRTIDLSITNRQQTTLLYDHLLAELTSQPEEALVAYRGSQRWVRRFEAIQPFGDISRPLRKGGVYLLIGGLGKIGRTVAHYLAKEYQAKLVLTGRSGLPPSTEWEHWLATHAATDATVDKIRFLRTLEAQGAEVFVQAADVAVSDQMQAVIKQTLERFDTLHGVLHMAGVVDFTPIQDVTVESCEVRFRPKVQGPIVLAEILRDLELDFCMLFSSLSPILGGLGFATYAAGNCFMDSMAQQQSQIQATPWFCVNWEGWRFKNNPENRNRESRGDELALSPEEGVRAFEQVLYFDEWLKQITISTGDLQARQEKWVKPGAMTAVPKTVPESRHRRPHLRNPYLAPRNDIEIRLTGIWQELLGIDEIGIHDPFMELGGHSLLSTQVISQIRRAFQINFPMRHFFEMATIERMAKFIEDACWLRQASSAVPVKSGQEEGYL